MCKKLICGPMATISHEAFRRLVEQFGGVDEYFTEMINAPSLLQKGPFEKYYLMAGPYPQKIVWQITGHESEPMAQAAAVLAKLGGIGIDINMGCSAPEIVRSGAGIAWMLKPKEETLSMVRKVRAAIDGVQCGNGVQKPQGIEAATVGKNDAGMDAARKIRLSVKLRLGAEDFVPKKFFEFCIALADCGVEQITLHPRTQKEKLSRPPRRHFVQELSLLLKEKNVRVIYNGNIKDKESALAALTDCPDVGGIMISRACVQKPWIFAELRAELPQHFAASVPQPKSIDLRQLGLDYIALLQKYQPPEFFKTRMQRFFSYYCDNFSFAHYIKTKMLNCATPEQAAATFSKYFEEVPDDCTRSVQVI